MTLACISCGSTHHEHLLDAASRNGRPWKVELRHCRDCDLVFLAGAGESFDDALYDYYAERVGQSREDLFDAIAANRHGELLTQFGRATRGRRLLDVGCGQGQFVDASLHAGWNVRGIDLARPAIAIGRSFGLPVDVVDFFDASIEASSYDLVTMFELIEHVPRPGRFLARAEEVLRPGGLVYLTTPNFASLDRLIAGSAWEPIHPEHLSYFTPTTLAALVHGHSSLELLELHTKNVSVGAMMHRARSLITALRQHSGSPSPSRPAGNVSATQASDAGLRRVLESSAILRRAKSGINVLLDGTRLGSSLTALLRRPS